MASFGHLKFSAKVKKVFVNIFFLKKEYNSMHFITSKLPHERYGDI